MNDNHLARNLVYSVILSVVVTTALFFLTFLSSGIPSISPANSYGCSLSHAYGFPIPFYFYNEPYFTQSHSCGSYVVSFNQTDLAADLAIWFVIAFLLLVVVVEPLPEASQERRAS